MKIIYTVIALFAFFVSGCQEAKQVESHSKVAITPPIPRQNSKSDNFALTRMAKLLAGVWLPSDYVREMEKTKSPLLASKLIPDISEMQIDPNKQEGDSLVIASSLNNHEGYGFKIWMEQENGETRLQNDARDWGNDKFITEFTYAISADTSIFLLKRDQAGKVVQTIRYTRVRGREYISQFGGLGYNYLARKEVVNGAYQVLDSLNNAIGAIEFDAESGKVSGFKFKSYDLQTDFDNSSEFNADLIFLQPENANQRKGDSFILKAKNDTIQLWTILQNTSQERGLQKKDLKYTLVKSKN